MYTKETYLYTQEPEVYTNRKKPTKETHKRGLSETPNEPYVDTKNTYVDTKETYVDTTEIKEKWVTSLV